MPKLWAHVNHGIVETQERVNTYMSELELDKSTRLNNWLSLFSVRLTLYGHMLNGIVETQDSINK